MDLIGTNEKGEVLKDCGRKYLKVNGLLANANTKRASFINPSSNRLSAHWNSFLGKSECFIEDIERQSCLKMGDILLEEQDTDELSF